MEEKEFLKQGDVTVTSERFNVRGNSYLINNITGVKTAAIPPRLDWVKGMWIVGVIMILAGIVDFAEAGIGIFFGLILVVIMTRAIGKSKPKYAVIISTSTSELPGLIGPGEFTPVRSIDENYVLAVAKALNEAIAYRAQ